MAVNDEKIKKVEIELSFAICKVSLIDVLTSQLISIA